MTFTVKIRSSPGALMASDYECPYHGRFTATVTRDANGDPPDTVRCERPVRVSGMSSGGSGPDHGHNTRCGLTSLWRISMPAVHTQFVITASKGKSAPKPHPKAMDQRMLAEGRKNDFRKQRKKIKEEERHARVKRLLS